MENQDNAGFTCGHNSGFHMNFASGWAVSVQWGPYNYTSKRSSPFIDPSKSETWHSPDAEIAVFTPEGTFLPLDHDDVKGYVTPEQVAEILHLVSTWPTSLPSPEASKRLLLLPAFDSTL